MKHNLKNTTLAAMFLAIGLVLPFLTGQIPQIGNMLLPMHIGAALRIDLRLAVWRNCRIDPAPAPFGFVWGAGFLSGGHGHGF